MIRSGSYFLPYEPMIRAIIGKYLVRSGYYKEEEAGDLYQEIAGWLIDKGDRVTGSHKGLSKFPTYLCTIVYYRCVELMRKRIRQRSNEAAWIRLDTNDLADRLGYIKSNEMSAETKMILAEYCKRLSDILQTYGKKRSRLVFSLRSLSGLPVSVSDLPINHLEKEDLEKLNVYTAHLNHSEEARSDQVVYHWLTLIFNLLERKNNSADAIRKWIDDHRDEIARLLNGIPPDASFDRESAQILFEYFENNHEKNLRQTSV